VDLYTNNYLPALGGFQHGNPLLTPERSYNVEGSLRLETRRATAAALVYYNLIHNFIFIARTADSLPRSGKLVPVFASTQADGRISGFEINGTAEPVTGLVLSGGYALLRSRNQSTGEQLPLMPADNLNLAAKLVGTRLGGIRSPYVEFGGKHAWAKQAAGFSEPLSDPDFINGGKGAGVGSTAAYTIFHAGVGGRFSLGASSLVVNLAVENLFDAAYRDFLDTLKGIALGQGRNVSVRISAPLVFIR
jgi:iron complex outermembrane receptor protein/hemoglobin/transferrin/lactoferrin receptor protein